MDEQLTNTLSEIRELRTERFAARFDHLADSEDVEARARLNEIEAKLAQHDLRALLAQVEADHAQHVNKYEAAVTLLTLRPTEPREIDVAQAQMRKNLERHGHAVRDTDLRKILEEGANPVTAEIEGVHYRRVRPQHPDPGPPPLTPEEHV